MHNAIYPSWLGKKNALSKHEFELSMDSEK